MTTLEWAASQTHTPRTKDSPPSQLTIHFSLSRRNQKAELALQRLVERWKPDHSACVEGEERREWKLSFAKIAATEASAHADALFDEVGVERLTVNAGESRFVQEPGDAPGSFAARLRRR